jgi:hypothetical protein
MAANTRYFVLANYAQKAIAGLVQAPSDRAAAVKKICKAVGGQVHLIGPVPRGIRHRGGRRGGQLRPSAWLEDGCGGKRRSR